MREVKEIRETGAKGGTGDRGEGVEGVRLEIVSNWVAQVRWFCKDGDFTGIRKLKRGSSSPRMIWWSCEAFELDSG